jgi:hypothetical protein
MRDVLAHLARHCHGDARPDCPILEELASEDPVAFQESHSTFAAKVV